MLRKFEYVQVTNSKHVITSLRTMASHGGTSKGFDRSAWSASLGPLLRSWERMMAANPALRSAPGRTEATPSLPPIDAFVELEALESDDDAMVAFCLLYLDDYVWGGYELPRACARSDEVRRLTTPYDLSLIHI